MSLAMSQADRLRQRVLEAAEGDAFGQFVLTEYVRSRSADGAFETISARWTGVTVSGSPEPGGIFRDAVGYVRTRRRAFADGYMPRMGDMLRRWSANGKESWFAVREVHEDSGRGDGGEYRLALGAPDR